MIININIYIELLKDIHIARFSLQQFNVQILYNAIINNYYNAAKIHN